MRAIAAEEALPPYVCLPEGTINLACNSGGGGGCQNQREGEKWEDVVHCKSLVPIFASLLDFLGTSASVVSASAVSASALHRRLYIALCLLCFLVSFASSRQSTSFVSNTPVEFRFFYGCHLWSAPSAFFSNKTWGKKWHLGLWRF
jgi:hypothetical protein